MSLEFNPEMLSLARDIRGITQKELAEKAGLAQGTISKYEGRVQTPSDHEIECLAEALDYPVSFFFREGKRRGTIDGHVFHRKKAKALRADIKRIDGHLELFEFQTQDLLSDIEFEPQLELTQLDLDDYDGDAELVAEAVRASWKMPRGPVNNVIEVLESAGCFVYLLDFGTDDIDENVQWFPPDQPIILANSQAPGDRLRFSLAHALGHLVMHQKSAPHKDREVEADQFASAFLMPAEDIIEYLTPVTLDHLIELKPYWKVSIASMIMRAHTLEEITDRQKKTLFQMLNRSGWRKNEPEPIKREKPQLAENVINTYREYLSYKDSELARKLKLHSYDFRRMYYPETPFLKII